MGKDKGLAYDKDSRSFTLYTDNEMLKAYNGAGDNVTVTIKPLSEAPTWENPVEDGETRRVTQVYGATQIGSALTIT